MSDIKEDGSEVLHYDNPEFPVFCRDNFIPAGYPLHTYTPIHWHDEVELIYITEGMAHHIVNAEYITIHKGEGLFINARQLHELVMDEKHSCRLYCLIFRPSMLGNCIHLERRIQAITENSGIEYLTLHENVEQEKLILESIRTICELWKQTGMEGHQMGELYGLWEHLITLFQIADPGQKGINHAHGIVRQMLHFIQKNYKEEIKLEQICRAGNVGKTKATELFKSYVHMTPMDYLNSYRIEMSLPLLEKTDMSVAEIAYEVGFQSASYYGETIKRKIGKTPIQLRRELAAQNEE